MNNLTGKDPLVLARHERGSLEFLRSGAYANLNDMAKATGKRVNNWMRLKTTKELIKAFEEEAVYGGAKPFYDRELRSESTGQFVEGGGIFAHPDIAIQFAQWCNPRFALWVSRQIRHLMQYGEVNLHYTEWSKEDVQQGLEYNRDDIRDMYG